MRRSAFAHTRRTAIPIGRARERGSILVNVALAMIVIVVALSGTELGLLFMQKRELQKAVDLAALAGARQMAVDPTTCPSSAVEQSIQSNLPAVAGERTVTPRCGGWAPPPEASEDSSSDGFVELSGSTPRSAIHVSVSLQPTSLFSSLGDREIHAKAIARIDQPLATFTVGSRLVGMKDSLLGDLLKSIGLDISDTTLVSYDGLAQVKVTPRGLLQELGIPVATDIGIGELNELLAGRQIELGELLNAVVRAAGQSSLLSVNAELVNAVEAALGVSELMVQLGTDAATNALRGVFAQIVAPDAATQSAVDVEVNALDLIFASVGVGTQKHAIAVDGLNVANLVKARVAVVEPPSIGIGGVGATAYTAQVRTFVDVSTNDVPLLGSVVRLKLPIMIDTVTGRGTLQEMCSDELRSTGGVDRARIQVDAPVLKVCIGRPGGNPAVEDEIFATGASCEANLQNETLLGVSLLGANLVSLNTKLNIDALPMQGEAVLAPGETVTVGNNPLALGTTLRNVTDALLASLLANSLNDAPALTAAQREKMAQELWGTTECHDRNCRIAHMEDVSERIEGAANGLTGFLGGLTSDVLGLLNELLTLDVIGLVGQVGQLVGGLLDAVGDLLGGISDLLVGNQCTGGGVLGFGNQGSDGGCRNEIAENLAGTSGSGASTTPDAVIALVGFLMQLLQPILDSVGNSILRPILENTLGLQLGQVDVHLRSLSCHADPVLVQ